MIVWFQLLVWHLLLLLHTTSVLSCAALRHWFNYWLLVCLMELPMWKLLVLLLEILLCKNVAHLLLIFLHVQHLFLVRLGHGHVLRFLIWGAAVGTGLLNQNCGIYVPVSFILTLFRCRKLLIISKILLRVSLHLHSICSLWRRHLEIVTRSQRLHTCLTKWAKSWVSIFQLGILRLSSYQW